MNYKELKIEEELALAIYKPTHFLIKNESVFRSLHFSVEDRLKLVQLDKEGCIYSETKFAPSFLKKLDVNNVPFFAFKYILKNKTKYALVLKSLRFNNASFLPLK